MPDRIDREIEEILTRLGEDAPKEGREPIPLAARRRRQRTPFFARLGSAFGLSAGLPSPTALLFTGAGLMVVGLILSTIWSDLIWAAFTGVVLFMAAFIWSFVRPRTALARRAAGARDGGPAARGAHWRGRYVEYEPPPPGMLARIRRAFRRR